MTHPEPTKTSAQPVLAELFAQYLRQQADAHAQGLGLAEAGEVVPHDAAPAQPLDPRLAWDEALAAVHYLHAGDARPAFRVPAEWSALVASHAPVLALPLCLGNFPQLVRDLHALLHDADLAALRPQRHQAEAPAGLLDFAARTADGCQFPQTLLAVGLLRLAGAYERAGELTGKTTTVPAEWRAAWENEWAALAWHQGDGVLALQLWQDQGDSVPVLFNRGMAQLFLGHAEAALPSLRKAADALPEPSGWRHLAELYVALAEARTAS